MPAQRKTFEEGGILRWGMPSEGVGGDNPILGGVAKNFFNI